MMIEENGEEEVVINPSYSEEITRNNFGM